MTGSEPSVPQGNHEFQSDWTALYQKWGIESLATFDLPAPMQPQLLQPNLYPLHMVSEAGLTCFIPWYLLKDKHLKLRDVADHFRESGVSDHLSGWLSGPTKWGPVRFGRILELYVYGELALKARYGDRLVNQVDNLNRAFAAGLPSESSTLENRTESIRKDRQKLRQRLRACDIAMASSKVVNQP